jgi:hypothetical protein
MRRVVRDVGSEHQRLSALGVYQTSRLFQFAAPSADQRE